MNGFNANDYKEYVIDFILNEQDIDLSDSELSKILSLRQQSQLKNISKKRDTLSIAKLCILNSYLTQEELIKEGQKIIYKGLPDLSKKTLHNYIKDKEFFLNLIKNSNIKEKNKELILEYLFEDNKDEKFIVKDQRLQLIYQYLITFIEKYNLTKQELPLDEKKYISLARERFLKSLNIVNQDVSELYFFSILMNESIDRTEKILNNEIHLNKYSLGFLNLLGHSNEGFLSILISIIDEGLSNIESFMRTNNLKSKHLINLCSPDKKNLVGFLSGEKSHLPISIKDIIMISQKVNRLKKKSPQELKNLSNEVNNFTGIIALDKIEEYLNLGMSYSEIIGRLYPNENYNKIYKLYRRNRFKLKEVNYFWRNQE